MKKDSALIISNTALSDTESNGRIFSLLVQGYNYTHVHNFCLGGSPDKKDVHYILMNDKQNIKSLCTFGRIKPRIDFKSLNTENKDSIKKKKAFHYFVRNILYFLNNSTVHFLKKYISNKQIKEILLFGTDAPYMYRLARILSKKCLIPMRIYTCEDYPLKDYNYIEHGVHNRNIFFRMLMNSLKKQTKNAFFAATETTFNSEPLFEDYRKAFKIKNPTIRYLPSILYPINYAVRSIKHIVYGGNLYSGRVDSLLDVSSALLQVNKTVVIDVYGKISEFDLARLKKTPNIVYHGIVNYASMVDIYKKADMLLHVDGFDGYSIRDFKHAFSTKISDCYVLGIPFFIYAPIEIASTQYGLDMNRNFTCISKKDLYTKLDNIINNHLKFIVDYEKIKKDFSGLVIINN